MKRWRAKPLVTSYEMPYDDGGCRRAAVLPWLFCNRIDNLKRLLFLAFPLVA